MQPDLSIGKFRFTATGVEIDGEPPVDEWTSPLQFAIWCQRAGPWWIGDLLNAGEARFGEEFSQACEGDVSAEMLQRYEAVARKVPRENRHPKLSWSAHAAVARFPAAEQKRWIEQAVKNGWSSADLQKRVRAARGPRR